MTLRNKIFKKFTFAALAAIFTLTLSSVGSAQIAAWDFFGENTGVATSTAEVFNANLDSPNTVTRGSGAEPSNANNSFRTTGFQNNGISTANTDYFQITLSSSTGNLLSLSTIDARFAGTGTFAASPGVSSQFAYSIDGTNFTLIGSPSVTVGTPAVLPTIDLTGITALQNVPAGTTVTIRYYASGQTTTGGWGFNSPAAGQYGLAVGGTVTPVVVTAPSFAISDATVTEGDTGTTNATFTVTKTNANGSASTVNFETSAGTATAGTDYTTTSGSLSFTDAETSKTITVPVAGEYNIESNETFFVDLTAGTNAAIGDGQGLGTINNDDAAGTVQFSTTNYSTLENNGTLTFTVTRTGGLGSGVTVTATTANDTAVGGTACTAGVDYISAAPVLAFSGGQTSEDFTITLCNDAVYEDFENFNVSLGSATGGLNIGSPSTAAGTINNDDNEPTYTIDNVTQNEGNSGTTNFVFTVTKNGTSEINTSIGYQTADGSATSGSDYQSALGTLNFAPNETTQTITVLVNGDTDEEPNETFFVSLGSIATRGVSGGIGTINNDDAATTPSVSLTVSANSGTEAGTTVITVTATLTGGTVATDQTVTLGTSGTATLNTDYTLAGGNLSGTTLTIPANTTSGSTTFTVVNDTEVEADETATLTISNPSAGIILGTPVTQNITIVSDDAAVVTLATPSCTGIAPSPLSAGAVNRALICFSLSSNSNADFTAVDVPFTADPSVRFVNPRLYRSTDADYTTTGDNVLLANGTANATQFSFSGFTAFAERGEEYLPSLTSTPTNFFVVADVALTVNSSTSPTQPSIAPANITVSSGTVLGASVVGQNFAFDAVPTAADGIITGRVINTNYRGLENVTVTLSGGSLVQPIVVYTNQIGRFRFTEIPTGEIYTITVSSKRHRFSQPSTAVGVSGNTENVNFIGEGW